MSDNRRRYHAIKGALKQLCPTEPTGNVARNLHTLAALVSGIVGSKSTHLLAIAAKVPDGSEVGRKCLALTISVIYKRRALPIAWIVVKGSKGHFPEETHIQLLGQVYQIVPQGVEIVVVGDGEFDGITFQATIAGYGWHYVCCTARNVQLGVEGERFAIHEVDVQPGECIGLPKVTFTLQDYGPVLAIAWWETGYKEPIYLVTNKAISRTPSAWPA